MLRFVQLTAVITVELVRVVRCLLFRLPERLLLCVLRAQAPALATAPIGCPSCFVSVFRGTDCGEGWQDGLLHH